MNKNVLLSIIAVVGLGLGFFGGMQYQKGKTTSFTTFAGAGANGGNAQFRRGANGTNGTFGGNGAANGFRPVTGSIISADAKSITVKMQDGSSKIVLLTGSTTIGKNTTATSQDLTTGQDGPSPGDCKYRW